MSTHDARWSAFVCHQYGAARSQTTHGGAKRPSQRSAQQRALATAEQRRASQGAPATAKPSPLGMQMQLSLKHLLALELYRRVLYPHLRQKIVRALENRLVVP